MEGMRTILIMMTLLLQSVSSHGTGRTVAASGDFTTGRVKAHYHVSIERPEGRAAKAVDRWINRVLREHIEWVYETAPADGLQYRSRDFARQYRAYARQAAMEYDKDLSDSRHSTGHGKMPQTDTLTIRKTAETPGSVTYTAQEYFCRGTTHPTRYKLTATFRAKSEK